MSLQGPQDPMLSSGTVARACGVHVRTLDAWAARPDVNFPKPIVVNGRRYWMQSEIDTWKASKPFTAARKVA